MIPNRAPGTTWCLRRDEWQPVVYTTNDDFIVIDGGIVEFFHQYVKVSRKDARLLAKRINQCLDATAKK